MSSIEASSKSKSNLNFLWSDFKSLYLELLAEERKEFEGIGKEVGEKSKEVLSKSLAELKNLKDKVEVIDQKSVNEALEAFLGGEGGKREEGGRREEEGERREEEERRREEVEKLK